MIKLDTFSVDRRRRRPSGDDPRPSDRHPELLHSHPLHERDVLRVLVVEVVGDVPGILGERVPDGDAAPALARAALDLVGGRRDAPVEGRRGGGTRAGFLEEAASEVAGCW